MTFQRVAVRFRLATARVRPSGANVTESTAPVSRRADSGRGSAYVGGVPEAYGALLAAGDQGAPVGAEGERVDVIDPGGDRAEQPGPGHRFRGPQPQGAVGAGAGEGTAVGAEGDRVDGPGVAGERGELAWAAPVGEVPEAHGAVVAGGGEQPAVGAEGDGVERAGGAGQGGPGQIPEPRALVLAPAGQRAPSGPEGQRPDTPGVPREHGRLTNGTVVVPFAVPFLSPSPSTSQRRTVPSVPPVASCRPSGLKATALTASVCVASTCVCRGRPACPTSQSRTVKSAPPVAS